MKKLPTDVPDLFSEAPPTFGELRRQVEDLVSEKDPGTLGFSAGVDVLSFVSLTEGTDKAENAMRSYLERFSGKVEL